MADDPNKVGQAVEDLNAVVAEVQSFVADNREALGTTSDKLASITTAVVESLDDIKQTLHVGPTVLQNFNNIYEPANGALTGALAVQQLRQPDHLPLRSDSGRLTAGRRASGETVRAVPGADHQEPPVQLPAVRGEPLRRSTGRPNEVTYSEDWMRPDYVPPPRIRRRRPSRRRLARRPRRPRVRRCPPKHGSGSAGPDEAVATNPAAGLPGMMVPPGGGS